MPKTKTEPLRMCAVTREMLPKSGLIRLVKTEKGILVDNEKRLSGRGVYITRSIEVIALAKKRKTLNRAFKCEIDNAIYLKLEELANGSRNQ